MTDDNPTTENAATNTVGGRARIDGAAYWRKNLSVLGCLLVVWFVCSFGFGILLVEEFNQFEFLGVKLGFWFAQQGSIYIFIALIFIYAWRMHHMDREFGVDDEFEPDSYDLLPDNNEAGDAS